MTDTFEIAAITFVVPSDCPAPARFKAIIRKVFNLHFAATGHAVECRKAWQRVALVPPPFSGNADAACHYRQATLALSRPAQQWAAFEAEVNHEFADFEDDGDRKRPAIRGWSPDWISLDRACLAAVAAKGGVQ